MTMETRGIAVFDVCGTITKTNNTSDFLEFVLRRSSLGRYGLLLLIRVLTRLSRLLPRRSPPGRDLWRDRQIALLRGYSCTRIHEMARLYVDGLFTEERLNEKVLEAMIREKQQGRTICLVSAAIAPPIAEIAERLEIETFYCSELEVDNGCYTGRLATDLLGCKESILEKIAPGADLQHSSVYSDNADDVRFMMSFGRRTLVLNGSRAERIPGAGDGQFDYLVNPPAAPRYKDVHSVNERTVRWTYIPPLYYLISRFHREGLLSLLFREMIPVTLAGYLATHGDARALGLVPLAFWMFYAVYEVGGLVNDLSVQREASGTGTDRIAPGVHIHASLFVAIRAALVGLLSALLSLGGHPVWLFLGALAFCLGVCLLHTLILNHLRMLTFLLLKICRISIPLTILSPGLGRGTLIYLCAMFCLVDVPWRMHIYALRRNLLSAGAPTWQIRGAIAAVLWVLGALGYALNGSFYLLAIASYYVALEFPRMVHR
jgi:HAD superfamily phosphoserine phosphatase-like hydrolase